MLSLRFIPYTRMANIALIVIDRLSVRAVKNCNANWMMILWNIYGGAVDGNPTSILGLIRKRRCYETPHKKNSR